MGLLRNSQHSKKSYLALPFRGDSQRQPDYIKPFLENIKKIYGLPLTVVRDMREEIAVSVSEVFTGVAQQICHYHFVRNIGDIIFKHRYEELRKAILDTHILAKILSLRNKLMDGISTQERIVIAEFYWVRLAIEYILHPREIKSCLLYTSDAADDLLCVDLGGRRIIKKKNKIK